MKWMHKSYTADSRLTLQGWQSWFCQWNLGIASPVLAPYTSQLCSCQRQPLDADHLHTCTKHSGKWHRAHEHLLTAVEAIEQASGYRTACGKHVSISRGQKRSDLEIKNPNVAVTVNLMCVTRPGFMIFTAALPTSPTGSTVAFDTMTRTGSSTTRWSQ